MLKKKYKKPHLLTLDEIEVKKAKKKLKKQLPKNNLSKFVNNKIIEFNNEKE